MPLSFVRKIVDMPKQFPLEVRDRAVRMTLERLSEYPSACAACKALAPKLGVGSESPGRWVVQALVDAGEKTGPSTDELGDINGFGLRCGTDKSPKRSSSRRRFFELRELDPCRR